MCVSIARSICNPGGVRGGGGGGGGRDFLLSEVSLTNFHAWKLLYIDSNFPIFCSHGAKPQKVNTGPDEWFDGEQPTNHYLKNYI